MQSVVTFNSLPENRLKDNIFYVSLFLHPRQGWSILVARRELHLG